MMKFLLTGDWHIDTNRPERRVDDYWKTVQRKIQFIVQLAAKTGCTSILQPGDFFNSHKANDFLKRYMIKHLKHHKIIVYTVFGQHDLRYHSSDVKNTPLSVLYAAGVVRVVDNFPVDTGALSLYGASWYEDVPKVEDPDTLNILIIHKMIIKNKKLWEGQEDVTFGNVLVKTSGFDLIVAGDNHQHFTISTKAGKHLVNCGSLLRNKIDQVDHTPIVYIYDTSQRTITPHEVPCEPFNKVFDMTRYEEEKNRDEELEAFVEKLTGDVGLEGIDFVKNMAEKIKQLKEEVDDVTLGIIEEVMG